MYNKFLNRLVYYSFDGLIFKIGMVEKIQGHIISIREWNNGFPTLYVEIVSEKAIKEMVGVK